MEIALRVNKGHYDTWREGIRGVGDVKRRRARGEGGGGGGLRGNAASFVSRSFVQCQRGRHLPLWDGTRLSITLLKFGCRISLPKAMNLFSASLCCTTKIINEGRSVLKPSMREFLYWVITWWINEGRSVLKASVRKGLYWVIAWWILSNRFAEFTHVYICVPMIEMI